MHGGMLGNKKPEMPGRRRIFLRMARYGVGNVTVDGRVDVALLLISCYPQQAGRFRMLFVRLRNHGVASSRRVRQSALFDPHLRTLSKMQIATLWRLLRSVITVPGLPIRPEATLPKRGSSMPSLCPARF